MFAAILLLASVLSVPADVIDKAFGGRAGAFVLMDAATGEAYRSDAAACAEKVAPCSTFKIWNTAIGLELGIVSDPDALFWKWDGKKRFLEAWSKDQTLRTAFALSCVPAYQDLARKIGAQRMHVWLDKIGYGDGNISAGIDVFWLPEEGRRTILISPDEQAALLVKLVEGKLPFSAKTLEELKTVMLAKTTERGALYGKTGTSTVDPGKEGLGWFVGYVESPGKRHAFACLLKGPGVMGKDARAAVESILTAQGLL